MYVPSKREEKEKVKSLINQVTSVAIHYRVRGFTLMAIIVSCIVKQKIKNKVPKELKFVETRRYFLYDNIIIQGINATK